MAEVITYWDGYKDIQVYDFNHLKELSQEETNTIVVGPQETFFEKLELINRELRYAGNEEIDVTKKWAWKQGHYDRMRNYLLNRLDINKKSKNMSYLIDRTIDRTNYLNYIQIQIRRMETERMELRRESIPYDVNLDEFKEQCIVYTDEIYRQCELANDLSKGKVIIEPYLHINGRQVRIILDILLLGLEMEVYSGDNSTAKIPLNDIHIIGQADLRKLLAGNRSNIAFKGKYFSDDISYAFPYIGQDRYSSHSYGTVCLDNFIDDVNKSFNDNNYTALAMNLMQWAQYYSLSYSNPYNQPFRLHYGMPRSFSPAYRISQDSSAVTHKCSRILKYSANEKGIVGMHQEKYINNKCQAIDCALMDTCNTHKHTVKTIDIYESDTYYEMEGVVGMIYEQMYSNGMDVGNEVEVIAGVFTPTDTDTYKEDIIDTLMYYLVNDWHNGWNYAYDWLVKQGLFQAIDKSENMCSEEVETLMKNWVESQRS